MAFQTNMDFMKKEYYQGVHESEYSDSWKKEPPSTTILSDWCRFVQWKAVESSKVIIINKKGKPEVYGMTLGDVNEISNLLSKTIKIYKNLESLGTEHARVNDLKKKTIGQIKSFGDVIGKKRSVDYFTKIQEAYNKQLVKLKEATDEIISEDSFRDKGSIDKNFDHDFLTKMKEIEGLLEEKLENTKSNKTFSCAEEEEEQDFADFFLQGYDTE